LEKGLQAVQHAQRIGGFEVHLVGCNLQMVGLIFIELLHGCARPRGLDEEQRFIEHSLAPQGNPGLPREDVQKALFGAFQARFLVTFQSDAEAIVDEELARARLHLRRKRHQGKWRGQWGRRLGLAAGDKRAEQQSHGENNPKQGRPQAKTVNRAQRFYLYR
jgi:hypothetical protein